MRFRKLRIAWSVAWAIACVLLIVLWVRSYLLFDQFIRRRATTDYVAFTSFQGRFVIGMSNDPELQWVFKQRWSRRAFRTSDWDAALSGPVAFFPATTNPQVSKLIHWPRYDSRPFLGPGNYTEFVLPYWLISLSVGAIATLPWLRWPQRFSLRTLLIATTLVAVVLGLIVAVL
jgi:hypothetical protein